MWLEKERKIYFEEGEKFSLKYNMEFFETSAKDKNLLDDKRKIFIYYILILINFNWIGKIKVLSVNIVFLIYYLFFKYY